jgi:uncharacterized membrane protein
MMLAVVLVLLGSLVVAGRWSRQLVLQARAQTVADVAALSAAAHGRGSASTVGTANGWELRSVVEHDGTFVVSVNRDGVTGQAAAGVCIPSGVPSAPAPHISWSLSSSRCR